MIASVQHFIREKIGLKTIGLVISALVITAAVYILYKELANIDWSKVGAAMVALPSRAFLLAGLFTLGAYLTLTAYDFFAVRTIGHKLPYTTCATGAFTSYSIAHNLGATVFTGAVVRYLIYSRHGLTAPDVIKICFIAGLTFWLGNAAVLGIGFLLEPQVIEPVLGRIGIGEGMVRMIGGAIILGLLGYLAVTHLVHPVIGKGAWRLALPSAPLTALQILIGIVDLTFCALIFYIVLVSQPGTPPVPFTVIGVILVASMLLGFASHTPGAVGAFEASMLIALKPLGFSAEQIVAAFIIFRLYYFVAPFILALLTVFVREFVLGGSSISDLKQSMAVIREAEADHEQTNKNTAGS